MPIRVDIAVNQSIERPLLGISIGTAELSHFGNQFYDGIELELCYMEVASLPARTLLCIGVEAQVGVSLMAESFRHERLGVAAQGHEELSEQCAVLLRCIGVMRSIDTPLRRLVRGNIASGILELDEVDAGHIRHLHLQIMSAGSDAAIVPVGMPERIDVLVD